MSAKGGKRENAGRKKGIPNKSNLQIKEILDRVVDFDKVAEKLFELSQGVEVQRTDSQGGTRVYTEKPDPAAARILIEYRFGKAVQPVANADDKPFEINVTGLSDEQLEKMARSTKS